MRIHGGLFIGMGIGIDKVLWYCAVGNSGRSEWVWMEFAMHWDKVEEVMSGLYLFPRA